MISPNVALPGGNQHNDPRRVSDMRSVAVSARMMVLAALALAALALASGCGAAAPQVVVTPMTPESEAAFENGVDFIDNPTLLEGTWLEAWESDVEHRVTLADAIAVVRITTVRRDTDLEHHDTYHLVAQVVSARFGTIDGDISLAAREGEGGFGTLVGNDDRLLNPPTDPGDTTATPEHFLLYVKWARDEDGSLDARWHLSPAGTRLVQRVNSLIEMRRQAGDARRRIIVHTTSEPSDDDD
jgi:hypothetical protein